MVHKILFLRCQIFEYWEQYLMFAKQKNWNYSIQKNVITEKIDVQCKETLTLCFLSRCAVGLLKCFSRCLLFLFRSSKRVCY
jgi:uncharacterized radical SAM superfamily Fe-S cluster-containing enzyme